MSFDSYSKTPKRQQGFSLVEISLVLIIAGLALGAGLAALGPQLQARKYSETEKQLQEASDLILAFAMVNRRLPCPATAASSGRESFCTNATGACGAEAFVPPVSTAGSDRGRCAATPNAGFLPAATLGMGGQRADGLAVDAWALPLRYVTPNTQNPNLPAAPTNNPDTPFAPACGGGVATCYPYTQFNGIRNAYYTSSVPTTTLTSDIYVCAAAAAGANCGAVAQRANPAFVVYSYGANLNATPPALGADEAENTDADRVYVWHERNEVASNVFDDLVAWRTYEQLVAKMQGNGVLP
ncbi:MAG: prepilin-type N-terminal cleavage/methylation domain-containing protein [Ramlibacter sp.]|nr:prepilin-type N-terminal cleavage/methylation domain-containing protein [Ramlibacter sp.]